MKAKNTLERHDRHKVWHRVIALLMCAAIMITVVTPTLPATTAAAATKEGPLFSGDIDLTAQKNNGDLDQAIHFIIRHWHAAEDPNGNESVGTNFTVVVEGYIVPSGGSYKYYSRAYNSAYEESYVGTYKEFAEVTAATVSPYIKLVDGKVQIPMNPYHVGTYYHDRFAGFSISCGQFALTAYNGDEENYNEGAMLVIDPDKYEYTHLVKAHVFYTSELLSVDGEAEMGDGNNQTDFPPYIDTTTVATASATRKYYNTSNGLHTDKTASVNEEYDDNRTFDLDLEAWFIDGDPVNVGLILDASGSMGFTANTPKPIRVLDPNDSTYNPLGLDSTLLNTLKTNRVTSGGTFGTNDFISDTNLAKILNTHNTDNSSIRSSGYTYFLFDPRSSVQEFVPLGYWSGTLKNGYPANGDNAIGSLSTGSGAGWYYINPSSKWNENYYNEDLESGKTLNGIPTGYTFKDDIPVNPEGIAPTGGTGKSFTPGATSASKFYIDSNGYLRCFYYVNKNGLNDGYGASYVYENGDEDYIKVEALQRALGTFVTELEAHSPESLVSAVRFSTADANLIESNLVLLDWTANVREAQQAMSMQRGTGGTREGTSSTGSDFSNIVGSGLMQYNYGLTGNTCTIKGLEAFDTYLDPRLNDYKKATGRNGEKYIIIFTDGKDTDLPSAGNVPENTAAYKKAEALKAKGYTIFCVMLAGGPVMPKKNAGDPDGDYEIALNFLNALAGSADKKDGVKYVYSTEDEDVKAMGGNSVDALVAIFNGAGGILNQIANSLENYNVQDYIDPRFDLVDADGSTWHLNANGNVVVVDKDGEETEYDLRGGQSAPILLSEDTALTNSALNATLKFDSAQNMYYLVWTEQTIPGSSLGAAKTPIWHGRLTVRAKDDFIGGNAVLSNGNDKNENYVYNPDYQSSASSGIDKSAGRKNENPSKGFPRTTVNVSPDSTEIEEDDLIYMGEIWSETTVAKNLLAAAKEATQGSAEYYYWEYLERYVEYYNAHPGALPAPKGMNVNGELTLEDLIDALFGSGDVEVPYCYLPNEDDSNQTGRQEHEQDVLGYLTYSIEKQSGQASGETKDTETRYADLTVTYDPLPVDSDRENANEKLVTEKRANDPVYAWDREYKEEQGDPVAEKTVEEGSHTTKIVSGEVALQVELSAEDIAALAAGGVTKITYTADLMRTKPGSTAKEKVGTFTTEIEITPDGGYTLVLSEIEYDDTNYDYVDEYGLPLGTYTLANCHAEFEGTFTVNPFVFYDPYVVDDEDEYTDDVFVLDIDGKETPDDYMAKLDTANDQVELGAKASDSSEYTDARFGLFRVTGDPVGALSISKTVKDIDSGDTEFTFTVKFTLPEGETPPALTDGVGYSYTGESFANNVTAPADGDLKLTKVEGEENTYTGKITLKHGQRIVFNDFPVGITYEITEIDIPDGYIQRSAKYDSGEITTGGLSAAAFINAPPFVLPETGGNGTGIYWLSGALFLLLATAPVFYAKRKRSF